MRKVSGINVTSHAQFANEIFLWHNRDFSSHRTKRILEINSLSNRHFFPSFWILVFFSRIDPSQSPRKETFARCEMNFKMMHATSHCRHPVHCVSAASLSATPSWTQRRRVWSRHYFSSLILCSFFLSHMLTEKCVRYSRLPTFRTLCASLSLFFSQWWKQIRLFRTYDNKCLLLSVIGPPSISIWLKIFTI